MAKQLEFSSLVKEMNGKNTINNWDVLVSYPLETINKLLLARSKTMETVLNTGILETTYENPEEEGKTPYGNVTLTFEVKGGSYHITKDNLIPAGLSLEVKALLITVSGKVDDGFKAETEKKDIQPPNYTVTIKPEVKGAATGSAKKIKPIIKEAMEDYFATAGAVKYFLASVSNQYESNATDNVLRPLSFCFTTVKGDASSDDESALNMWIAVQGGRDGGKKSTGATQPNLRKGFDDLKETTVQGTAGLKSTGKLKADTVEVEKVDEELRGGPVTNEFWTILPSVATSRAAKTDDSNKIKYTSNDQSTDWQWWQQMGSDEPTSDNGTVKLSLNWNAKGGWNDASLNKSPNQLGFKWTKDKTWNVDSRDDTKWRPLFWSHKNEVPSHFKDLSVPGPDIDLNMDPLDYFLTTNLLFPGEQIFKADDPAGTNKSTGLAIPHDLILTGDIKTKQT